MMKKVLLFSGDVMANVSNVLDRVHIREISWARLVSDIISPPVVWIVLGIAVASKYAQSPEQALLWSLIFTGLMSLLPLAYVGAMVYLGKIGDIHMKNRRERYKPLIVTLVCALLTWLVMRNLNAPRAFPLLALISFGHVAIITLITLRWQISMHSTSLAGVIVAAGIIFEPHTALLFVPLLPLVGAARLKLRRHTIAQVVAGVFIGILVPAVMLIVFHHQLMRML